MADNLKLWRTRKKLTQAEAAALLGVSQPYLSLLEKGVRPLNSGLRGRLNLAHGRRQVHSADDRLRAHLGALGYPGFAHIDPARPALAPDAVLVDALSQPTLDARVTEALPWLLRRYSGKVNWTWLVTQAKLRNLQNRMGFLIQLALASYSGSAHEAKMRHTLKELDPARLLAEATFCRDSMPASTRRWMREHRSPEAKYWNVVTRMLPEE